MWKGKKKISLKIKSITNRCLWSQLKETPGNMGHNEVLGFQKSSGKRRGTGPARRVGGIPKTNLISLPYHFHMSR